MIKKLWFWVFFQAIDKDESKTASFPRIIIKSKH